MPSNETVLMDRSRNRVPASPSFVAAHEPNPAPGTVVWYGGKRFARKIGIATGRMGTVDGPPIPNSGGISVSFPRILKEPKEGEDAADPIDKSPEAFILSPRNLRPVPASVLAKKEAAAEEARKARAHDGTLASSVRALVNANAASKSL